MTTLHSCPHCNAPAKDGTPYQPYCCVGCKTAYALVSAAGLDGFYKLRDKTRLSAVREPVQRRERLWLEQQLQQAEQKAGESELVPLRLDVQGLECAACVWLLEKLYLRRRPQGAVSIEINPAVGRIDLVYRRLVDNRTGQVAVTQFLDEAEQLGYRTGPAHKQSDAPLDDLVLRLGLCAALAMNSMIFAFSQYFGLSQATDPALYRLFAGGGFVLGTATVLIGGTVFFRSAWQALMRRSLHMDVPIALGILLTYLGSVWSFVAVAGRSAYFDTLCIFITLMLLGRLLQRRLASLNRQRLLADDTVAGLLVRTWTAPTEQSPQTSGQLRLLPAASLQPGHILLCAPGELLPVEATLLDGDAEFSLDWILGESAPVHYQQRAVIPAGAHNRGTRAVRLRAEESFSASRLRDLLCAPTVEKPLPGESAVTPARTTHDFWDFLSRVYVIAVLTLATVAFALWIPAGMLRATEVAVAVLVVTCPCALGIATPLAYELAQARLRRRGLFVRTPSFFDRALALRKVLLDKTGTVTLSQLVLSGNEALLQLAPLHRDALFQMVARSNHPVSRALLAALQRGNPPESAQPVLSLRSDAIVRELSGQGLILDLENHSYRLGQPEFALHQPESANSPLAESVLSLDGIELARFVLREELCRDARSEVEELRTAGYQLVLISGDRKDKVTRIAKELGITQAYAEQSPEQKCQLVQQLDGGAHDTLMIGDGINDALAFSAAACAGTPAIDRPTLPARADFYYAGVGIGPIGEALRTARFLRQVIVRNLALASLYNCVVLGLSFAGLMTPLRCALAMPLGSLVMIAITVAAFRERDSASAPSDSHTAAVRPSSSSLALAEGATL
jgi:Cu2+-exporting ATPase